MRKIIIVAVLGVAIFIATPLASGYSGAKNYTNPLWVSVKEGEVIYMTSGQTFRVCPENPPGSGGYDLCHRLEGGGDWRDEGPVKLYLQPLNGVLQVKIEGPGVYPEPSPTPSPTPEGDDYGGIPMTLVFLPLAAPPKEAVAEGPSPAYRQYLPLVSPEANAHAYPPSGE